MADAVSSFFVESWCAATVLLEMIEVVYNFFLIFMIF